MITVEKITETKDGKGLNVYTDRGYELTVTGEELFEFGLLAGKVFSEEEFEEILVKAAEKRAYRAAVRLLGYRDYSEAEMLEKLESKGIERSESAVGLLKERGYINDRRYGERIVERYSGVYGKRRIDNELRKHGIEKEIREELLGGLEDSGAEDVYGQLCRMMNGAPFEDRKQRDKKYAYFIRRGYGFDEVTSAFEKYGNGNGEEFE